MHVLVRQSRASRFGRVPGKDDVVAVASRQKEPASGTVNGNGGGKQRFQALSIGRQQDRDGFVAEHRWAHAQGLQRSVRPLEMVSRLKRRFGRHPRNDPEARCQHFHGRVAQDR